MATSWGSGQPVTKRKAKKAFVAAYALNEERTEVSGGVTSSLTGAASFEEAEGSDVVSSSAARGGGGGGGGLSGLGEVPRLLVRSEKGEVAVARGDMEERVRRGLRPGMTIKCWRWLWLAPACCRILVEMRDVLLASLLLLPPTSSAHDQQQQRHSPPPKIIIEPSVLAADIGNLAAAAKDIEAAGATWVHVDVCDGSRECCRALSSLGPASIAAIHKAAPSLAIDVHLYVLDPEEHVDVIAASGVAASNGRITFQIETLADGGYARARALAERIRALGCHAGVCLAPSTSIDAVDELCRGEDVDLVDVLAVLPGIGGQSFSTHGPAALEKVRALRQRYPRLPYVLVDGGIDDETAHMAADAGANALVAGSYLFKNPSQMGERFAKLEEALLVKHGAR